MKPRGEPAAVRAVVTGLVQGVYFRRFAANRARELGVSGYARNLPDGTVEVLAEGEAGRLQQLINHLHSGPPAAKVTDVVSSWSEHSGAYHGFSIR